MMIRTQHPDIILLSVLCSRWCAVSMSFVVKVNDTGFSAYCTASWHVRVAKKVAIDLAVPCWIIQPSGFGPCRLVPFMEVVPASFNGLSGTFIRAVFPSPVVSIYPRKWLLADPAKSFFVRKLSVFENVASFLKTYPLTSKRAVKRIKPSWLEIVPALGARLVKVVLPSLLSLAKSIVVAGDELIPVMRRNSRSLNGEATTATAFRWMRYFHFPILKPLL